MKRYKPQGHLRIGINPILLADLEQLAKRQQLNLTRLVAAVLECYVAERRLPLCKPEEQIKRVSLAELEARSTIQ